MTLRELITKIGFSVDESGLQKYDQAIGKIYESTDKALNHLNRVADNIVDIGKRATLFLSAPIGALATTSVMAEAQVEKYQTQFEVMLKSADRAKTMMAELFQFEAKTPFILEQVMKFSNSLLIAKQSAETVTKEMMKLGDVAAGDAQRMESIVLVLGQVRQLGYLQGHDILQFTSALVPIREAVAQVTGVRGRELQKMIENRKITADIVEKAMDLISKEREGMMMRQSQTLIGIWTSLMSAIFRFRVEVGKLVSEELGVKKLFQNLIILLNKAAEAVKNLTPGMRKFVAVLGLAMFAIGPLLIALGTGLKLFIGWKIAMIALNVAGLTFAGVIGKIGIAVGVLSLKFLAIAVPIAMLYLLIQDIYMYIKHGDNASLLGPLLKSGFDNWLNPMVMDLVEFFKNKWSEVRKWWDLLWSDPFKALKEAVFPDWLVALVQSSSIKGGSIAKEQYVPMGMFMPATSDASAVSIGDIHITAPVAAGTSAQMKDGYIDFVKLTTGDAIKEAVKQIDNQRK